MKYKHDRATKYEDNGVNQDIWSTKQSANVAFVSAFYDIKFNKLKNITPFIGAGIGISQNKSGDMNTVNKTYANNDQLTDESAVEIENASKKTNSFAWHVSAGVNYVVNDKIDLNLVNYKYANLGKAKTMQDKNGDILTNKLRVHSVSTGITFKF
jgi:opacity protein-like surface antigen